MQDIGNSARTWIAAMRRGDFPAAWRIADAVLAARDPATRDDAHLPYHLRWVWDGRPPDGRHVLVRCYHGLGDTLQFARYLAPLRARARSVTLEVQPALAALLHGLADQVVPFDVARPLPPAAVDVEIMELAHVLRLVPEAPGAWLRAASAPIASGVSLCWSSGAWDCARDVPLPALLDALGSPAGLVSLQRGPASAEAGAPPFANPGDDDPDVMRTARLIRGSRLVVTVDTMVAHLAGCLGAPTLLLLRHEPDWRWGEGRGASRWYPSITMLRQEAPGDWSAPLAGLSRRMAG